MVVNKEDQSFDLSEYEKGRQREFANLFEKDEYNWTAYCDNEWQLLTCILLDTRTPLERLRKVVEDLKRNNLLDFRNLSRVWHQPGGEQRVANILFYAGYPWYNQKARYFGEVNDWIEEDYLKNADFEMMQKIVGIGPKLAALWMRIVHGLEIPVIDSHVKRWMFKNDYQGSFNNYNEMSNWFTSKAKEMGVPVNELDRRIVAEGIAKRRGLIK